MEKRRRERINRSLEELKNLILDQTNHNVIKIQFVLFCRVHFILKHIYSMFLSLWSENVSCFNLFIYLFIINLQGWRKNH